MGSDLAIRVEGLGKRYRIGERRAAYRTLRETVAGLVKSPGRVIGLRSTSRETIWALRDVDLEVRRGEVLGVIGRNGAGKSTLLKILSRITEPTEGRVELHGRVGSLLEVGTGFHPELTGRENIYLNGAILGMRKADIDRNFDEIVAFAEIEKFLDTPVKRYSSGMYVRLAFAVAAHLEPEILLVDEVLAVGDAGFQRKCLGKMGEVANEGRTVLFVSHNLGSVTTLCGRAIMLQAGQLLVDSDPQRVIDRYVTGLASDSAAGPWLDHDRQGFRLFGPSQSQTVCCGQEVVLEFRIESPRPITNPTVGIVIHDFAGTPVVGASSKWQRHWGEGTHSNWTVRCQLRHLPLTSGMYRVSVWVGNPDRDLARFPQALSFSIEEGDPFGFGMSVPRSWGYFYWKPDWRIARSSSATPNAQACCDRSHD
jgi:homopolymeric O-antigen transport system ATP-binding protein